MAPTSSRWASESDLTHHHPRRRPVRGRSFDSSGPFSRFADGEVVSGHPQISSGAINSRLCRETIDPHRIGQRDEWVDAQPLSFRFAGGATLSPQSLSEEWRVQVPAEDQAGEATDQRRLDFRA
jgi:hypothetical protein